MKLAKPLLSLYIIFSGAGLVCAHAATVAPLSLHDLSRKSDSIVVGVVKATESEWRDGQVVSRSVVEVHEQLLGDGSDEITLTVLGGTAIHPTLKVSVRMAVAGAPVLKAGDTLLLFSKQGALGERQVVGLSQGMFRITRNEATGEAEVSVGAKTLQPVGSSAQPLEALFSPFAMADADTAQIEFRPMTLQEVVSKIRSHLDVPGTGLNDVQQ